jgi:hypothetical protein
MEVPNALTRAMNEGRLLVLWGDLAFPLAERPPANRALALNQWAAGTEKERPQARLVEGLPALPPLPVLSLDPGDRVERAFAEASVPLQVVRSHRDVPARNRHSLLKLGGDLGARRGVVLSRAEVREVHGDRDKRHLLDEARRVAEGGAVLLLGCDPASEDFRALWGVLAPAFRGSALYSVGEPTAPWPEGIACLGPDLEGVSGALRAARPPVPPPPPKPVLPYDDVEIHVGASSVDGYPVTIETSRARDATGILDLPWPADRLRGWLAQLEGGQTNRDTLIEIGHSLFQALFHGAVRDRYMAVLDEAESGVRLRLWLDASELQALPWELLYDDADKEFLALSGRALVTRYLPVPRGAPPLTVTPPLRVLVAVASPHGHSGLNVEAEAAAVGEALAPAQAAGLAQVEILAHARVMALREALRDYRPHVLHFAGHGAVGPDGGALVLEDEAGDGVLLSARQLRVMRQRSGADVCLAVLNACLTARDAEAEAFHTQRRALLGVGPALVQAGLGAVVGMQFSLTDASARLFSRDFYSTVVRLEPVDLAVSRAREALALEAGTHSRDWATPVLFLRAPDGVIFARP